MNTTFTTYAEKKAKQFLNLLQGYSKGIRMTAILILLLMGVNNAWASGGIGYKGVKFTKNNTTTGWYNIHDVSWDYAHSSYECRSGKSGVTNFDNADLGIVTSLKLHSFVVIGWTNSGSDYVAGQLKHRLYKQSASAGSYSTYNVGNYGNNSWGAYDVLIQDGDNRVVGKNGDMNITLVDNNTAPGQYYLQLHGLGRIQWTNDGNSGSFSDYNGSEVKAQLVVPGFTTTSKSQAFDNTQVNNSSSKTISFGTHYGTALKTSNCSISGTNASEFSVTSIDESGVTVQFEPTSAGDKNATLTITDEHNKTCTITLSGNAQSPTPSITISTAQQYLQIGKDKLNLTINYTNIPEGHCYRVKVGDGYYNGNANGENNDSVSISSSGSVAFTTYSTLPGGTQSIVVELWKSNPFGATSTKSNAINVTVEQGFQVSIYTRIGSTNTPTGTISPTEHIGKTITATAMPGYAFTGWTSNTDNITFEDASAPSTLVYAKSGGDIYANYTKENCVYFVNTSNWSSVYAYARNGGGEQKNAEWPGVAMTKTDEKIDGHDVYKYCEPYEKIIFNNNDNGQQTGDLTWETDKYYVYDTWYEREEVEQALQDMKLYTDYYLVGEMNSWNETANAFKKEDENANTASLTIHLDSSKEYKFKVKIKNGNWYGFSGNKITATSQDLSFINNGGNDCILKTTIAGDYVFTWNFNNSKLSVQYPSLTQYSITYHANGGSGTLTPTEYNEATDVTLPTPTKTGYTFDGWYTTSDFSGNKVTKITKGSTGDKAFWAKWTPAPYTITYHLNGGEGAANSTYTIESANITLPTPTRIGHTFVGWYENADFTGNAVSQITKGTTGNKEYWANWVSRNLYIHADFVNWEGRLVEPEFKNNSVVYTYTGILEKKESSYNNEHTIWDGGHHFHYLYSLEGFEEPETQKIAYNYYNVDAGNISYTQDLIDAVHLTDDNNPTIQFGLTKKSRVTITLTLVSDIETDDKATQPDVAIVAIPCNTITLDQTGARTQGTVTSVEVPNGDPMPAITGNGSLPTGANGYIFKGYYDQQNGQGTQYYNQEGTAYDNKTWDKTEDATLYAYFEKAQITQITLNKEIFEPVPTGEAYVIATPTIEPDNVGEVIVCWRLLYNDGTPVEGYDAIDTDGNAGNKVQFSIVGLATGSYKIEATLHAGSACGNGEPLSTLTKNFIIASEYTVTVKYTCDNQEIKASTTAPAQATETTSLTAPDIFGYTFKEWTLGDGVSSESTLTDKTISYTAIYDGTITAKYTKRKLIYFKRPADWGTTIYYYNIGSEDKWKNNIDGVTWGLYTKDITHGAIKMTRIENSDVYYYDYEATQTNADDPGLYIAFADEEQNGMEPMNNQCHVSWPIEHTRSFNEGTPMFVAANYIHYYWDAKYYNAGYWTNYVGETGYTLKIYDKKDGDRKELYSIPFEAATTDNNIPFKAVVDLEAGKTYGFKFVRANGIWYKNDNDGTMTNDSHTDWPFIWDHENGSACGITTTAAGDYTFTLNLNNATGNLQISVDYPAAEGDYRILYRDNGEENWSGNTRPQNWCHPSRIIKKKEDAKDIISFFINHDKNPELQYQTVNSIDAATGKITWSNAQDIGVDWSQIDTSGVYNFVFVQDGKGISLENTIEPYTGNYYIRCDAFGDKWDNYDINPENRMTYSAFSESEANSFGEKFSHYAVEWCPRGTNVKFTIANDYSPCITDTLIQDVTRTWDENIDQYGNLKSDGADDPTADKYSANIRFMWNRNTNKISRAYLSSATNVTKKFLILQGDEKMADSDGNAIAATTYVPANATLLQDKENWIYETTIKVKPGARVKLYACYTKTAVEDAQYFRGKKGEFNEEENTVQILGGREGDTWYTMRVIYDFKTNRLLAAWIPDTQIGDEGLQIDADIMIIREHQEEATCINLTEHTNSKLTEVKTVYGVMRFNRWILNNRANPDDLDIDQCSTVKNNNRQYDEEKVKVHHPVLPLGDQKSIYERSLYFISFPFDVKVSDIFGFGTYWNEWYIEYYDGLKRATEGFFIDSPPNWKYVTPEMADTFKLRAYQGYILGLDLDYMQYNDTSFWTHNMQEVELFFPSTTTMGEIAKKEVTMPALGTEYECKINRPNSDHRVIDSYWRCIGVPSYANYDGLLYAGKNGSEITWKTDRTWTGNYTEFPFLYSWNTTDNTITPRSTREFKFKAMHSYLVQNKSQIYWKAVNVNVTPSPAAIMAREMEETRREYEWRITLTKGEKEQDQTFIRLTNHEQVTTEFDFNQDLSKEFNYGRSDIYTLIGYEKAAANSLPFSEQTTLIPLGLSIEYNGDYTIAMPGRMENIGVTLIDTESNTRTNLSAGMEYTLTLNKGDYNNRFFIEISPIQQTPTDIEYVTGDSNSQNSVRKVLIDNILYIVRDGQIFDARGARVK